MYRLNILEAARSKACSCRRSLTGIAGSNSDGTLVFLSYECCVLSSRGFCVGLITRPEESYWVRCFQWVWSPSGRIATGKSMLGIYIFFWTVISLRSEKYFVSGSNILKCDRKLFFLRKFVRKRRHLFWNYDNSIRYLLLILCLFTMIAYIQLGKFCFYEGNNLENKMPLIGIHCILR